MALERRIDSHLLLAGRLDDHVHGVVRPIQGQRRREGDEEVVERESLVLSAQLVPQPRPGQMVDPRRMHLVEFRALRPHPVRQTVVVLLVGANVPAHDQEHDVQHRDLFRGRGQAREGGEDVGEEAGEGVGVDAAVGTEEAVEGRVCGTEEVGVRHAFCFALAPLCEEVEE